MWDQRGITVTLHFGSNFPIGNPADERGMVSSSTPSVIALPPLYFMLTDIDPFRDKCTQEDL